MNDKNVKSEYEADILSHSGIRLIGKIPCTLSLSTPTHCGILEPELFRGYNPKVKCFNQEVELTRDLKPMELSEEEAAKFKLEYGDKCDT